MPVAQFHPAVRTWFEKTFARATDPQRLAWPAIASGRHTLIAAPTGSGKTLAAFLAAIDALVREGLERGLADETHVVYVSPLKALSNDIERNLRQPLAGIRDELLTGRLSDVDIRVQVRTGDTTPADRAAMRKTPPHILVTTPESLYLLLTSESGRVMLATTRSVIVDEIHAIAGTKRGAHLALSLERLDALHTTRIGEPTPPLPPATYRTYEDSRERRMRGSDQEGWGEGARVDPRQPSPSFPLPEGEGGEPRRAGARTGYYRRITRIGLSATQKPIEDVARFLVGADVDASGAPDCVIVDTGHVRNRDLAIELTGAPLQAVMPNEVWDQIYDRLTELIRAHRTTLLFVNTRRLAERLARHLSERLGKEHVTSHHGSLAKESRFDAEQRLKRGELRALVATASLELGIDIGDVDLVCQIGSPRAISTFLQRVGRSGHSVTGTPKGRLFPLTRDELIESAALLDAVTRGELDRLRIPAKPLDVLAQQIVAEVASQDWTEDALYQQFRRAHPYRGLERGEYGAVVRMLADGFSTRRGRRSAYLHRDAVNGVLRGRQGARLTALTCGGAIPDNADYRVVLEPVGTPVGTLNEDFAIESMAGDIFQLGNSSYRILKVEPGIVRVEDAKGMPPTIPFWIGEAPARTDELSAAVSRLRAAVDDELGAPISAESLDAARGWLAQNYGVSDSAAAQIIDYLAAAKGVLHVVPTQSHVVFERFFDETGGMQLVIHAPFGSRINRAWGLALRKRFCRKFNFELQAAATEDTIVLSLGETHSFPLADVARYLHSASVRDVLVQALLAAPLFTTRWRWTASIALAVKRFRSGRKNPAPLQRMDAEDLIAVVFPDQIACAENLTGEREIPDHPLVEQTIDDCLHEAMDVDGLIVLLQQIERGEVQIIARDLPHPSPLAQEILNAKPYAFLDDAPLEERRTQAVMNRRWLDPLEASEFGRLDPDAIARVRVEAWPDVDDPDELHDALMLLGYVEEREGHASNWRGHLDALIAARRATRVQLRTGTCWVAAEQLPMLRALHPDAPRDPAIDAPAEYAEREWTPEAALVETVRARLQGLGPVTVEMLTVSLDSSVMVVQTALLALEAEGFVLRGEFTESGGTTEWCERRLLARIHRYTVDRLRAEIEPVAAADFLRFLFEWQGVTSEPRAEGPQALAAIIEQLQGYEASAIAWESEILRARMEAYDPDWLDDLCRAGRVVWARLTPPKTNGERTSGPVRSTPITLLPRRDLRHWQTAASKNDGEPARSSPRAQAVADYLRHHGASFFEEIASGTGLLKSQVEEALGELVALGRVQADSFGGLRALLLPADKRRTGYRRRRIANPIEEAGRWSLLRPVTNSTGYADNINRISDPTPPLPSGEGRGEGAHVQPRHPSPSFPLPEGEGGEPKRALRAHADDTIEHIARALLRRYGVVFRKLLTREQDELPPWIDLLRVYRRLEARGEIRGGRFVAGFSGEQYALAEAVPMLRTVRRKPKNEQWVSLSAADPLNLVGVLTPGARVPALAGNRVLYRDGVPVAVQIAGKAEFLIEVPDQEAWNARNKLIRGVTRASDASH